MAVVVVAMGCGGAKGKPAEPDPSGTGTATAPTAGDDAETRRTCCEQCSSAAGRDPAGMDISIKSCTAYRGDFNGAVGVDETCFQYFEANPTTVGDCANEAPQ